MNTTFQKYLNCLALAVFLGSAFASLSTDSTRVVAWGIGSDGQTNIPSGLSNVIMIAAGDCHSLALKSVSEKGIWTAESREAA